MGCRFPRLYPLITVLILAFILFVVMFGRSTYQERWERCVKKCASKGLFGRLELPRPQYGRDIPNSFKCQCY
ncbi:hypothetical protein IST495A_06007 [Burkholderia multivorans]|nr:hypothetical protein IST495A_06007 [Burkholderia multivorans]